MLGQYLTLGIAVVGLARVPIRAVKTGSLATSTTIRPQNEIADKRERFRVSGVVQTIDCLDCWLLRLFPAYGSKLKLIFSPFARIRSFRMAIFDVLRHRNPHLISIQLVLAVLLSSPVYGAIFAGYDPTIHDRYANGDPNPSFLVDESDISGISGDPSLAINRAHLITPFHFITSRHASVGTVRFRASDGMGGYTYKTYAVGSGPGAAVVLTTDLGGGMTIPSDIRLYRLAAPIPDSDGVIPMPIFDGAAVDFLGQEIYVMGQNNVAGRNVIRDLLLAEIDTNGNISQTVASSYTFDTNPGHPLYDGVGDSEVKLQGGDSGHATLMQVGDEVALVGVHIGIDSSSDLYQGLHTSFSSVLAAYLPEIRSIVEADGYSIRTLSFSTVPEPGMFAGLAAIGVCGFGRRRRSKAFQTGKHSSV